MLIYLGRNVDKLTAHKVAERRAVLLGLKPLRGETTCSAGLKPGPPQARMGRQQGLM
jgi:hypothetical protein